MQYWKFTFASRQHPPEVILAFVSDLPFDSFEETDSLLHAYLPASQRTEALDRAVEELCGDYGLQCERELLPDQNWNEEWESRFQPIRVGNFCGIRATHHPPFKDVRFDLLVQPKMAFGTGHHETTRCMIAQMETLEIAGKSVFDYGCGTGILAILALQQGAARVLALDIEEAAVENTRENAIANQVKGLEVLEGDLKMVTARQFDVILANINRNVILDSLSTLNELLAGGGQLLASGYLEEDGAMVEKAAMDVGFRLLRTLREGNWLCQLYQRS